MKQIYNIVILFLFVSLFSCSNTPAYYAHSSINIPTINKEEYKNPVDSDAFEISEVIHLELPSGIADVQGRPVFCNDRIYMYDVSREYVLAFDSIGKFLFKVGGLGHARNEIIDRIETFDVDRRTNYVHVYNRQGMKIIVFDDKGEYVKTIMLHDCLPSSIVIANDGSYIASLNCLSSSDGHSKLAILDNKGKISKVLMEDKDKNDITCEGYNTRPLFSDHKGNALYLSMLSDSIVQVSGDTIQHVFNVDFADGFLSESEIRQAKKAGKLPEDFDNIKYISKCAMTDAYCLVEFMGKRDDSHNVQNYTYLLDRKTKRPYLFSSYIDFPGLFGHVSNIVDDEFICVILEEDVLNGKASYEEYDKISKYRAKVGLPAIPLEVYLKDNGINAFSLDLLKHPQKVPLILKIKLKSYSIQK